MVDINPLASGSSGNCYLIDDGSSPLLLECGIRMQEIREGTGFGLSELAGCLISHEHQDHCKAVEDMMRAGVDCYMSKGTKEMLSVEGHRVRVVRARETYQIAGWKVMPFEIQHDAAEPLGFLVQSKAGDKLLYATDTYYMRYKFPGLSHIMIECNYSIEILDEMCKAGIVDTQHKRRVLRSHMSLETAIGFFRANDLSQVREIWLVHLSDDNSNRDYFKSEIQAVTGKPVYIAGGD